MNNDRTTLDEVLGQLPRANPDSARSERVRARCHAKLAPRLRASRYGGQAPFIPALESAVVGGFCAVYFSLLMLIALRSHGLL